MTSGRKPSLFKRAVMLSLLAYVLGLLIGVQASVPAPLQTSTLPWGSLEKEKQAIHKEWRLIQSEPKFKWLKFKTYEFLRSTWNLKTSLWVLSVIQAESQGYRFALGKPVKSMGKIRRARGLMQVMDFHYKGNPRDLFQEKLNLELGIKYLQYCARLAGGDKVMMLKNYNSGPSRSYVNWPYVEKIIASYNQLKVVTSWKEYNI